MSTVLMDLLSSKRLTIVKTAQRQDRKIKGSEAPLATVTLCSPDSESGCSFQLLISDWMLHVSLTLPRILMHDMLVTDCWLLLEIYLRLTLQLPPSRPGPNLWRMSKLFWDKLCKSFRVSLALVSLSPGTLILVLVGNGAMAQAVLSLNTKGNFFSVNFGSVSIKCRMTVRVHHRSLVTRKPCVYLFRPPPLVSSQESSPAI